MQNIYLLKDLYPEYIMKSQYSVTRKQPHSKMGERVRDISPKTPQKNKTKTMSNKHMKTCSTSLVITEKQNQFMPIKMAKIK